MHHVLDNGEVATDKQDTLPLPILCGLGRDGLALLRHLDQLGLSASEDTDTSARASILERKCASNTSGRAKDDNTLLGARKLARAA